MINYDCYLDWIEKMIKHIYGYSCEGVSRERHQNVGAAVTQAGNCTEKKAKE